MLEQFVRLRGSLSNIILIKIQSYTPCRKVPVAKEKKLIHRCLCSCCMALAPSFKIQIVSLKSPWLIQTHAGKPGELCVSLLKKR